MKDNIKRTHSHPIRVEFFTEYVLKEDIACFQRMMEVHDTFKVPTIGNENPKRITQFFSKLSKNKINGLNKEKAERDVMDNIQEKDMFYIFEDSHIEAITQCNFSDIKAILEIEKGVKKSSISYLHRFTEGSVPLRNICRLDLSTWSIVSITGEVVGRITN